MNLPLIHSVRHFCQVLAFLICGNFLLAAQPVGGELPEKSPAWFSDELEDESQALWDKLRADGKVTVAEVLQEMYLTDARGTADVEGIAARLLLGCPEDPIPALREMLRHNESSRRVYAATIAGNLGDVRLEQGLAELAKDKSELTEDLAGSYPGKTVGDVAESALKAVQKRGMHGENEGPQLPLPPWLLLRPEPSWQLRGAVNAALGNYTIAEQEMQARYRKDLAEAISSATDIEIFLLGNMSETLESPSYGWQREVPAGRFPITPYECTAAVLSSRRLLPDEVKALMPSLQVTIRAEKETSGASCHNPVHGLRIWNGGDLIFQTSICYHCTNFYMEYPYDRAGWTGLSSEEFQGVMEKLMPFPAKGGGAGDKAK